MLDTHPHGEHSRQNPSCSTFSSARLVHKSPAAERAREGLHTASQAAGHGSPPPACTGSKALPHS